MVLFRPLRLPQRLDEPLSVLVYKVCLCSKIDTGLPSLCSSLRGLNSTIQLRIDSYQPTQACPWKFHNAVYTSTSSGDLLIFRLKRQIFQKQGHLAIFFFIIFKVKSEFTSIDFTNKNRILSKFQKL